MIQTVKFFSTIWVLALTRRNYRVLMDEDNHVYPRSTELLSHGSPVGEKL
jgi:hypothetical protein